MNHIAALVLTLATATTHASAQFASVTLVEDGHALEYRLSNRGAVRAPVIKDQVGFASPKLAPAGARIGWLAEFPGSNTSYAIPLRLVVMGQDKKLRTFSGPQAIFSWCFTEAGAAVTFRQAALHGPTEQVFEMRRISDGKLLKKFALPWQGPDADASAAKIPEWARCAMEE